MVEGRGASSPDQMDSLGALMFVVLQLPFVDLRGLYEGELGRSPQPNWRADDPGECFVRNFGGMSTRNARAYGLVGERAYVEFEHALAFPKPGQHRQDGWRRPVALRLWFRRLYFDGDISGRFEIGFNTDFDSENELFSNSDAVYDFSLLARSVCDVPVQVRSPDGTRAESSLEKCGETLGLSYLVATTLHSKRHEHPASELIGTALKVGAAALHIRATADTPMVVPGDSRDIVSADGDHLFLTSVAKAQRRNTVIVQISKPSMPETPEERARRVLFSHLNSVLHANDFLTEAMDAKTIAKHRVSLKDLTARAVDRFGKLTVTAPKTDGDQAFADALKLFATEHGGRIDDVVAKLDALAKDASAPSRFERIGGWVKGWTEFFANSAIDASVKAMMSAR